MCLNRHKSWFFLTVVILLLCACGHQVVPPDHHGVRPAEPLKTGVITTVEDRLRQAAQKWQGTPHRMGGQSRGGIDCSGLVQVLYKELFNIRLPRTTSQQVRRGIQVDRSNLRPGDLVFFHPPGKKGHVGIYLSSGQFLHVSTRRGVMISHLQEPYWQDCYLTARRVLK